MLWKLKLLIFLVYRKLKAKLTLFLDSGHCILKVIPLKSQ